MTRIAWGIPGSKTLESGLDRGVLFPIGSEGIPWNGLISVTESSTGGDVESYYYDGVKYLDVILNEDFQATLEAYDSPPEFGVCDGRQQVAMGLFVTQQPRYPFGLAYRNQILSDLDEDAGYKMHLLYNCLASPSERVRRTRGSQVEAPTLSWTIYTHPAQRAVFGGATYKPTAHFIVDSRGVEVSRLAEFEDRIYGDVASDAELPTQQEVVTFLNTGAWT